MGSERVESNVIVDMIIKDPRLLLLTSTSKMEGGKDSNVTNQWPFLFYPTGWIYQSKVRMNRFFDELLAGVDPRQRRWFGERAVPSSPDNITDFSQKIRYLFVALAAPVFETAEKHYVHAAAVTDQARMACALERFRLVRGKFPLALTELVPDFVSAIPVETVNGEPYRYRRTDDGSFVLYSVGTDLRDDGGVINPKRKASRQLDWVWRYPAK
jgi:hypothetical protein